jgi:hypothetical protein
MPAKNFLLLPANFALLTVIRDRPSWEHETCGRGDFFILDVSGDSFAVLLVECSMSSTIWGIIRLLAHGSFILGEFGVTCHCAS